MAIKVQTNFFPPLDKPKMYFVYILYDKHVSWEFSMKVLREFFHKDQEKALAITNDILTDGEGICGVYMFDIAETKATKVEELAKKEGMSLSCLVEEV